MKKSILILVSGIVASIVLGLITVFHLRVRKDDLDDVLQFF